jgi:hypothetical protein
VKTLVVQLTTVDIGLFFRYVCLSVDLYHNYARMPCDYKPKPFRNRRVAVINSPLGASMPLVVQMLCNMRYGERFVVIDLMAALGKGAFEACRAG